MIRNTEQERRGKQMKAMPAVLTAASCLQSLPPRSQLPHPHRATVIQPQLAGLRAIFLELQLQCLWIRYNHPPTSIWGFRAQKPLLFHVCQSSFCLLTVTRETVCWKPKHFGNAQKPRSGKGYWIRKGCLVNMPTYYLQWGVKSAAILAESNSKKTTS